MDKMTEERRGIFIIAADGREEGAFGGSPWDQVGKA